MYKKIILFILFFIATTISEKLLFANGNNSFNFNTKTVKLNSGYEMPLNGIGTYLLSENVCFNSVLYALKNGVRLIDTAFAYYNEGAVGNAIKESGVKREDIFITTKLWMSQYNDAEKAIDEALKKLNVKYIDLMLLHHPGNNDVKAYKAMEKAVREGKIRSIGLSNWYIKELKDFLPQVNIMPAVIQNEIHPYYQETEVIKYIQDLGIVMEGYYSLGGRRGQQGELLNNTLLKNIANKYNKSVAQIILRWNLQRNIVVIPGSSNTNHIKENTQIYDFVLTDKDMEDIKTLNRNTKFSWY